MELNNEAMKFKILILFGILIVSCSEVRFEKPQPEKGKQITEFPQQFIGSFLDAEQKDTLFITQKGFSYDEEIKTLENERVSLKKVGNYYILSCREILLGEEKTNLKGWEVLPFQLVNDTLTVFYLGTSEKEDALTTRLEKILSKGIKKKLRDPENPDSKYLLINPTKREFKTLLKENIFNIQLKFTKID